MRIESVPIFSLHPYPGNAKKHPQAQIEQIKASIQQFGNNDPIAVDEAGMIIEGHGRYEALKQLGFQEVEVVKLSGLTDDQKRAYILVHNHLTMDTGFNLDRLREEIEAISTIDLSVYDLEIDTTLDDREQPAPAVQSGITKEPLQLEKFNLILSEEQYQELLMAIDLIRSLGVSLHNFGNPNKRNNLIFEVVYKWAEQKKLL